MFKFNDGESDVVLMVYDPEYHGWNSGSMSR